MKFNEFEHDFLPHILIPLIGGLFVFGVLHSAARAEPLSEKSYIVSASDGYGVNDCIRTGDDCAKIVADAWCEAHGLAASKSYGPADATSPSIDETRRADIRPGSFLVACGE